MKCKFFYVPQIFIKVKEVNIVLDKNFVSSVPTDPLPHPYGSTSGALGTGDLPTDDSSTYANSTPSGSDVFG